MFKLNGIILRLPFKQRDAGESNVFQSVQGSVEQIMANMFTARSAAIAQTSIAAFGASGVGIPSIHHVGPEAMLRCICHNGNHNYIEWKSNSD